MQPSKCNLLIDALFELDNVRVFEFSSRDPFNLNASGGGTKDWGNEKSKSDKREGVHFECLVRVLGLNV